MPGGVEVDVGMACVEGFAGKVEAAGGVLEAVANGFFHGFMLDQDGPESLLQPLRPTTTSDVSAQHKYENRFMGMSFENGREVKPPGELTSLSYRSAAIPFHEDALFH